MNTVCRKCHAEKPPDDFYKSDPKLCKECVKARVRRNREKNAEYYRAYDRLRYRQDEARKAHCQAAGRNYNREKRKALTQKRRDDSPEKFRARNAVNNGLRNGTVKKPDGCFFCQSEGGLHAHHEDYSHPLDIVWLCSSCHGKLHQIRGDMRRAG